jgi:hypoxia up-regulated 1
VGPGIPFHIVIDEQAKRKVPTVVGFDHGERHFGNGAVQLALRKPKDTYLWAHRLLGKDINAPQVQALKEQGYPWEIIELPERGSLGFRHAAGEDGQPDVVFSVEEIVAMSLQHVMKIAEADAGSPVKDCVLTVPDYWTHRERQALLDAAELAGLNVLSLVNENTAAAIQYGIDRKYSPEDTKPHTALIYNMGSTSTKVTLASYTSYVTKGGRGTSSKGSNRTVGQVDILSFGFDDTLGGHAFELRIADWIIKQVNAQFEAKAAKSGKVAFNVRSSPKAMAKVRSAAEKAKIVLSANQEAQVFLTSLHDDMDFKFMLTREEFITELAADLIERSTGPIAQAMADYASDASNNFAGPLAIEDVDAVVIIGGGVRIPAIQAALKSFTKRDVLAQNLDGDEAVVMGTVFRAANQSVAFKVRPFGVVDTTPFAVGVRITNQLENAAAAAAAGTAPAAEEAVEAVAGSDEAAASSDAAGTAAAAAAPSGPFSKRALLYKRHNKLGKKKTVQFAHTSDFVAVLSHEAPNVTAGALTLPTGITLPIDVYNITGLARLSESTKYGHLLADGQKPRVSLAFMLDHSGLSSLLKADATLEEMVRVLKPKAKVVPKVNATASAENATTADANSTAPATEGETPAAAATEGTEAPEATAAGEDKPATEEAVQPKTEGSDEAAAAAAGAEGAEATDAAVAADAAPEEPEYIMKKKTHTISLTVSKIPLGVPGALASMNATQKLLAKATLEKLRRADDLKKEIAAAKNTLEAHIYATRAQMHEGESIEVVSTQEQRDAVMDALAAAEEWLYDQADDSASIFHDKLAELRKLSDPILFRRAEVTALPQALNTSSALLSFVAKQVAEYPTSRPWVPQADLDKLAAAAEDAREWLEEQQALQAKVSPHDTPVLDSEAVYERLRSVHKLSDAALKLKKPVEKPKPKTDGKKNNNTKTGGAKKNKTATTTPTTEEEINNNNATNDKEEQQTNGETKAEQTTTSEQQEQQEQTEEQQQQEDAAGSAAGTEEGATTANGADADATKDEL